MLKQIIQPKKAEPREPSRKLSYLDRLPDLSSPRKTKPSREPMTTESGTLNANRNILSNDVEITGNIKFCHDLIIDGKINGEIVSDGNLTVGKNAVVQGEITTKSVTVYGKIEGNVQVAERAELKADSELVGDIKAATLSIEEGATFVGGSAVGSSQAANAAAAPSYSPTLAPVEEEEPPSKAERKAEKQLAAAG